MSSSGAATSFLSNASNFQMGDLHYTQINQTAGKNIGWDLLVGKVAHTALYDSGARFDPPKCDEDTRVEVTSEIMGWIQDRGAPTRLLCMTGPAGAGKSAIQQTIAERCADLGILAASFFFAAADDTRNDAFPVVPTIAYQLSLASPSLRSSISAVVSCDPLIFTRSIEKQMKLLIVDPVVRQRANMDIVDIPYVILIDGLDECKKEERQGELLAAIESCLLSNDLLPFRVFIASRPEIVIYNALQPSGHLHHAAYHIQLDHKYNPDADIASYFRRRFHEIARRCLDPRAKTPSWPGDAVLDTLICCASGQFVYAATVIRYVQDLRGSPVDRLNTILSWSQDSPAGNPLASLHDLYRQILLRARDNYRSVDDSREDLMVLIRVALDDTLALHKDYESILFPENGGLQSLLHDLRSLIDIHTCQMKFGVSNAMMEIRVLRLHHYTFREFLSGIWRSEDLHFDETRPTQYITSTCFAHADRILALDDMEVPREDRELLSSCTWILLYILYNRPPDLKAVAQQFLNLNLWAWLSFDAAPSSVAYHFCVVIPGVEGELCYRGEPEIGKQLADAWVAWKNSSGIEDHYTRDMLEPVEGDTGCVSCGRPRWATAASGGQVSWMQYSPLPLTSHRPKRNLGAFLVISRLMVLPVGEGLNSRRMRSSETTSGPLAASPKIPNARFQLNNAVQKLYGDRGRLVSSVEHIPTVDTYGQMLYIVRLSLQVEYQDNFGASQRKHVGTGYDLRDDMASEKACIDALYYLDKHYPKTITIVKQQYILVECTSAQ